MSPERDEPSEEQEQELYEDVPPRSIFAATWFRVVLVVIVLGVIGAVAVPYVLDWMNPPPPPRSASATRSPMMPAPVNPSGDNPVADQAGDKPALDKPVAEKKDSMPSPAPPRPESRSEPRPEARPEPPATAKAADKPAMGSTDTKAKSAMTAHENPAKVGTAKPGSAKPEPAAKSEATRSTTTKPSTSRQVTAKAATPPPSAAGPYWVQVGAFRDADTAKRLAAKLRDENFKVEESLTHTGGAAASGPAPAAKAPAASSAPASDQYDVFVTGMSVEELNRRLAGKGLAAEAASGGVVVKPSLPLRDAVALSKDLAVEGFKVQVRRAASAGAAPSPAPTPPAAATAGTQELHRVRVGAFSDRASAVAAARELEAKGYKPYIARGDQ